MNIYRKFVWALFIVPLLLAGNSFAGDVKTGTLVIDETQVMVLIGGDMGGGTLLLGDKSYSFKTGGLKIGGLGVHKIHLVGDVYDLNDVADFPGVYFAAEAGATLGDAGKGAFWLKNSKGVKLKLRSSKAEGVALSVGVEGFKITMK
jgi:hypothetical protein